MFKRRYIFLNKEFLSFLNKEFLSTFLKETENAFFQQKTNIKDIILFQSQANDR